MIKYLEDIHSYSVLVQLPYNCFLQHAQNVHTISFLSFCTVNHLFTYSRSVQRKYFINNLTDSNFFIIGKKLQLTRNRSLLTFLCPSFSVDTFHDLNLTMKFEVAYYPVGLEVSLQLAYAVLLDPVAVMLGETESMWLLVDQFSVHYYPDPTIPGKRHKLLRW